MSGTAASPDPLVICGNDVGVWNISADHRAMTGSSTRNSDRIAPRMRSFDLNIDGLMEQTNPRSR